MVIWSCTIFELSTDCNRGIFESILDSTGTPQIYGVHDDEDMTFYVENIRRTPETGSLFEIELDVLSPPFYVRDRGEPRRIRITSKIAVFLYSKRGWPPLFAVFAGRGNRSQLIRSLHDLYASKSGESASKPIFNPVIFKLREQEECLMKYFHDIKRIKVDQIKDFNISSATLIGHALEEHPLFQQWVRDDVYGGRLQYFGIYVRGETVIINSWGNLHSRQGTERRPIETVTRILESLIDCKAIHFQTTLEQYRET